MKMLFRREKQLDEVYSFLENFCALLIFSLQLLHKVKTKSNYFKVTFL